MKLKRKKLLAIILTIAICMSNMMGASASTATTESDAEEENVIKEDYDDISFDYTFKVQSEWENHYTAEMTLKNTGKQRVSEQVFDNCNIEFKHQLTVYPYEEDEELNEDDCIWEGDVEDDVPMSVVEDEIFDEDDYDRVEEDELAKEVVRKKLYSYLQIIEMLILLSYR